MQRTGCRASAYPVCGMRSSRACFSRRRGHVEPAWRTHFQTLNAEDHEISTPICGGTIGSRRPPRERSIPGLDIPACIHRAYTRALACRADLAKGGVSSWATWLIPACGGTPHGGPYTHIARNAHPRPAGRASRAWTDTVVCTARIPVCGGIPELNRIRAGVTGSQACGSTSGSPRLHRRESASIPACTRACRAKPMAGPIGPAQGYYESAPTAPPGAEPPGAPPGAAACSAARARSSSSARANCVS